MEKVKMCDFRSQTLNDPAWIPSSTSLSAQPIVSSACYNSVSEIQL